MTRSRRLALARKHGKSGLGNYPQSLQDQDGPQSGAESRSTAADHGHSQGQEEEIVEGQQVEGSSESEKHRRFGLVNQDSKMGLNQFAWVE